MKQVPKATAYKGLHVRWGPATPGRPIWFWVGSEQAQQREGMKSQTENKGEKCLLKKLNRL